MNYRVNRRSLTELNNTIEVMNINDTNAVDILSSIMIDDRGSLASLTVVLQYINHIGVVEVDRLLHDLITDYKLRGIYLARGLSLM